MKPNTTMDSNRHAGRGSTDSKDQDGSTRQNKKESNGLKHEDKENVGHDFIDPEAIKGCEIYITRIPKEIGEDQLRPIVTNYGKVTSMRLMYDQATRQNRGYAYVRYSTAKEAKEAIKHLNNRPIAPNKHLVVTKSVDNRRLWVNGIPKNKSVQEIRSEMVQLTNDVADIILYPSQNDKTKSRGYMFVEYKTHRAAAMARRKLTQGPVTLCGHEVGQVDWAEPETEVDEEIMATVRILFVRNLSNDTSEEKLKDLFNRMGNHEVERVRKTKDFAFIHFASRSAAEKALNESSSLCIDGAQVEVLWSKPVDKKLYNTRKTLTKMLTQGAGEGIPSGDRSEVAFQQRGQSLDQTVGGPRRRGAAGIRGLGAPGTLPSKQLVQLYCPPNGSSTGSGSPGTHSSASSGQTGNYNPPLIPGHPHKSPLMHLALPGHLPILRSPTEVLEEVCHAYRWGDPIYHQLSMPAPGGDQPRCYSYRVIIPNLPVPPPYNSFQINTWRATPEDAKLEAAQFVLSMLRIPDYYVLSSINQMYSLNPSVAALHGVPLTITPPTTQQGSQVSGPQLAGGVMGQPGAVQGGGPHLHPSGNGVVGGRMLYNTPQEYNAYSAIISSMYGMNLSG